MDLRARYEFFEFEDLVRHPAIVYIPDFYNTVEWSEFYSMNIPLFTPTVGLLMALDWRHGLMHQRICWPENSRPRHPLADPEMPHPTHLDPKATQYWLGLSEPYDHPHVQRFRSLSDLQFQLGSVRLDLVSEAMREHNNDMLERAMLTWADVIQHVLTNAPQHPRDVPTDFDAAMKQLYSTEAGITEPQSCERRYNLEAQVATHKDRLQSLRHGSAYTG